MTESSIFGAILNENIERRSSGIIVDLVEFSFKENQHAKQRTLPANSRLIIPVEGH